MKQNTDMTRQSDIAGLKRTLDEIIKIKDIVIKAQLTLAVMAALNTLEDAMHRA